MHKKVLFLSLSCKKKKKKKKKTNIFTFPIVKMNANYAEMCRVGNLEADFQHVPLVHFFFLKFSQYCCET